MLAKNHIPLAFAAWAGWQGIYLQQSLLSSPADWALVMLGAMLPDIDSPRSWLGQSLPLISKPLNMLLGHRGWSHALDCLALIIGLIWYFQPAWLPIITPLLVGYVAHLLADMLTPRGIWFSRLFKWRLRLPLSKTGSRLEGWLSQSVLIATLVACYWKV